MQTITVHATEGKRCQYRHRGLERQETLAHAMGEFPGRDQHPAVLSLSGVISNCLLFTTALVLLHDDKVAGKRCSSDFCTIPRILNFILLIMVAGVFYGLAENTWIGKLQTVQGDMGITQSNPLPFSQFTGNAGDLFLKWE